MNYQISNILNVCTSIMCSNKCYLNGYRILFTKCTAGLARVYVTETVGQGKVFLFACICSVHIHIEFPFSGEFNID